MAQKLDPTLIRGMATLLRSDPSQFNFTVKMTGVQFGTSFSGDISNSHLVGNQVGGAGPVRINVTFNGDQTAEITRGVADERVAAWASDLDDLAELAEANAPEGKIHKVIDRLKAGGAPAIVAGVVTYWLTAGLPH